MYSNKNIPRFITLDGNQVQNKWNIPSSLKENEMKILIAAKEKAYMLDVKFCWCCCIGLDPLVGKYCNNKYKYLTLIITIK